MQRKLRKACSLPTCSQRIGQCMHCTCDGRCGQHEPGMCGVSREGNGKACKQIGCSRDNNCLHSTRATCCQCRNLIATKSSSAQNAQLVDRSRQKRRAMVLKTSKTHPEFMEYPLKKAKNNTSSDPIQWNQMNPIMNGTSANCDPTTAYMDDILELLALDMEDLANEQVSNSVAVHPVTQSSLNHAKRRTESPPSLWECEAWQARKSSCNLVIVVDNIQFFVHKIPVLMESKTLERLAVSKSSSKSSNSDSNVPVIHLPSAFPGDAQLFEQLCIYWYTGVLPASLLTSISCNCLLNKLPTLIAAMEYLEMSHTIQKRVQNLFNVLTKGEALEPLVCFMNHVHDLTLAGLMPSTPAIQDLVAMCMQALTQRVQSLTVNDISALLTLPNDVFTLIIQQMMNRPNDIADQNLARMLKEGRITKNALANWNTASDLTKSTLQEPMESYIMENQWNLTSADSLLHSPSGIDMSFVDQTNENALTLPINYIEDSVTSQRSLALENASNWAADTSFTSANRMIAFNNVAGMFAV